MTSLRHPLARRHPTGGHAPRRHWLRWAAAAVAAAIAVGGTMWWSAVVASRPGNTPFEAKAADWFRDHGMQGFADLAERLYYEHHAPPIGGVPHRRIAAPAVAAPAVVAPTGHAAAPRTDTAHSALPAPIAVPAAPLPNEGSWVPLGPLVAGHPALALAEVRPDALHTSVLAGVVWIDPKLVDLQALPGTVEPGGGLPSAGTVPPDRRRALLAAFNGGFRFREANGGMYVDGREVRPLVTGAASFVIRSDGTVDVGAWGRDDRMTPGTVAVRQNLSLVVDGGRSVPGLDRNDHHRWGQTLGNRVFVWRSGIGIRRDGTLVYAASDGLTVSTLADLLVRAGAVRAMELDINPFWVTFNVYRPAPADPSGVLGTKLLPDMHRPGSRYLTPDSRDFVAIYRRSFAP